MLNTLCIFIIGPNYEPFAGISSDLFIVRLEQILGEQILRIVQVSSRFWKCIDFFALAVLKSF